MGIENNFIVDTEGHCFLCSNHILTGEFAVNFETGLLKEPTKSSLSSLQCLSRYLKMDMSKVFNQNDAVPHFLLEKVKKSVLKASLCLECTNLTESFSLLYRELEKIKMKVVSMVNIINDKLKKADKQLSRLTDHVAQGEGRVVGKREIAKALRMEAMQKCSRKLAKIEPRVKLENLPMKRVEAFMKKSSHRKIPQDSIPAQNSESGELPGSKIRVNDGNAEYDASGSSPNMLNYDGEYFENNQFMDFGADEVESSSQSSTHCSGVRNPEGDDFVGKPIKAQGTIVVTPPNASNDGRIRKYRINQKTGKYECCLCPKEFAGDRGVVFHYNAVHLNIKYKCRFCEKEFKYHTSFNNHLKTFHRAVTIKSDDLN